MANPVLPAGRRIYRRMDLDVSNPDVSIVCRVRRGRMDRVGGGGLCAAFASACFRKQDRVPPTSGPIQFTLNPQRSKSPVFSRNSCQIKTSLLRRFYDALNYECVPGLCDTALEATQSAVSKQLCNALRKSAMFCFLVSEVGHY